MKDIKILDCTLRDGGYMNDWRFGEQCAKDVVTTLDAMGLDYIEVGFLMHESPIPGRMIFEHIEEPSTMFPRKQAKRSIMVKHGEDYLASQIPDRESTTIDMIRVMLWSRLLDEGLYYCKDLIDKGYEVGIQATRTDQYTDEQFADFVRKYDAIHPTALYIVDSFGLLGKERVLRYAEIADDILSGDVLLGYHAHNSLQQAYTNSVAFLEHDWKHNVIIDASILGMGQGAGNLPLELICKYMREKGLRDIAGEPIIPLISKYISPFFKQNEWGYSIPYMLSATYGCNPRYVKYLLGKGLNEEQMAKVFALMKQNNTNIRYNLEICDSYIDIVTK